MAIKPQPYTLSNGDVRYKVRFRVPAKKNPTSESFTTLDAARKFIRLIEKIGPVKAQEMRQASDESADETPTLRTYFDRHLTRLEASATPGTVADYRRMAERTWLTQLGDLPIDMISRDAVVRWVSWQRKQETRVSVAARAKASKARAKNPDITVPEPITYATKSISNAQRLLSTVLEAAVRNDVLTKNPAKGVQLPSDQHRDEMVFLTEGEFARLYAKIPPAHQPFVAFLAATGCRWGEATAVQAGDFDLDASQPIVRISRAWKKDANGVYLGATKTRRGERTITLPRSLVEEVRPLVESRARFDMLVFTSAEGERLRAQNWHPRVWHRAIDAAELGKRPRVHDLRHSHASWLIAAGVPLPVVQRRLGHESIQTTVDVYGHLAPDAHAGAADAVGIALAGALPQIEG